MQPQKELITETALLEMANGIITSHADFIHGLAHGAPVLGIGEGEQLPLHPRPAQVQRNGAGMGAIRSDV